MAGNIITLTTDFGEKSGFVGVMKGVILSIAPKAVVVDITHEVEPRDVVEGSFMLETAVPYFPEGTIHVAVVDPGVGTARRPILVETDRYIFIGPDNGIFTPWLDGGAARHLDNDAFFNKNVSATFHGRDIFAPVAGHLAAGKSAAETGPVIIDPVRIDILAPIMSKSSIEGRVVHVDSFGNLITNIGADLLAGLPGSEVMVGNTVIFGIVKTYGDVPAGTLCALIGSHGRLEIAMSMGNAGNALGVGKGAAVKVLGR